jgi:hypothetical protein
VNYQTVDVTVNAHGVISPTSSADTFSYTDWTAVPLSSAPGVALGQVSCASPTRCTAIGGGVNDVYFFNGLAWTEFAGPSGSTLPATTQSQPQSASCVSATNCIAVGISSTVATGQASTLIYHFNGTTWTQETSVSPTADSRLFGVSCVSATFCIAVGDDVSGPLVERYNGTVWSQVAAPNAGVGGNFEGVTCLSTTECTAVGSYFAAAGVGPIDSLIEHYNGSKWTIAASPNPATSNGISSVSCTSATNCTAVAPFGFALHFNGTTWSTLPTPASGAFASVSCASATDCTGVGTVSLGTTPSATLVAHYDGTTWTSFLTPSPNIVDLLDAVDCRNSTFCVAVGASGPTFNNGFFGTGVASPQPLLEMRTALTLSSSVAFPSPGQLDTLSATSPVDVSSIGSALDIVDTGTGKVVGSCAAGTTCTTTVTLTGTTIHTYVAEIGTATGTNVTAVSAPLALNTTAFSLTLTTSTNAPAPAQAVTLTATATSDVAATGSPLRIVDTTTGKTVGSCSSGVTCSASVVVTTAGVHTYQAVINGKAKVSSTTVSVTWQATTVTLTASTTSPGSGQAVTLTATPNFNPGIFGVPLKIIDIGTGRTLATCTSANCTIVVDHYAALADSYEATIAGKVQITTAPVSITWPAVTLTLAASTTSPAPRAAVTLTATAGAPLGGAGESLTIVDTTTGKTIAATAFGTTVTASVKFASGSQTYQAQLLTKTPSTVEETSTPIAVTW